VIKIAVCGGRISLPLLHAKIIHFPAAVRFHLHYPMPAAFWIYIFPLSRSHQICSSEGKERVLLLLPLIIAALNAGESKFIILVCALFAISLFFSTYIRVDGRICIMLLDFRRLLFGSWVLKAGRHLSFQFGYWKCTRKLRELFSHRERTVFLEPRIRQDEIICRFF
jgi:hypothetical protein